MALSSQLIQVCAINIKRNKQIKAFYFIIYWENSSTNKYELFSSTNPNQRHLGIKVA